MHKRNNRRTERKSNNTRHRKQEFYMDHLNLWRRVRRGIARKKQNYSEGQRQEITAAELDDLTAGAFIWGAEPTADGARFYIQLPPGDVIALVIEGAEGQALKITKSKIR